VNLSDPSTGRLENRRVAGKGLAFLDIVQDGHLVQIVLNFTKLGPVCDVSAQQFRKFPQMIRRGDILSTFPELMKRCL
jgi:hypothetical protein